MQVRARVIKGWRTIVRTQPLQQFVSCGCNCGGNDDLCGAQVDYPCFQVLPCVFIIEVIIHYISSLQLHSDLRIVGNERVSGLSGISLRTRLK